MYYIFQPVSNLKKKKIAKSIELLWIRFSNYYMSLCFLEMWNILKDIVYFFTILLQNLSFSKLLVIEYSNSQNSKQKSRIIWFKEILIDYPLYSLIEITSL